MEASSQDSAEKLSLWVGVFDAGTLHALHQAAGAVAMGDRARMPADKAAALKEQLHQVRSILARAIATREAPDTGRARGRQPFGQPAPAAEPALDFALYRQHYQDLQRTMELMIGPLRESVRQALADASPALRQLAALDAAWAQILAVREQKLMASVPARLRQRFERLRKDHLATSASDAPQAMAGDATPASAAWLDVFARELQQVLLAELDVRLEPVTGLIEAFEQEG